MTKNVEVELRILLKNRNIIEAKVKERAKFLHKVRLKDHWYCSINAKSNEDANIDNSGYAMRIRENLKNGKCSLDCKVLSNGKDHFFCDEYEVGLNNFEEMSKILSIIGFKKFLLIDKERDVYQKGNVKFCFDNIKGLGDGLEIEIISNKKDLNSVYNELLEISDSLGIGRDEIVKYSLTFLAMKKLSKF